MWKLIFAFQICALPLFIWAQEQPADSALINPKHSVGKYVEQKDLIDVITGSKFYGKLFKKEHNFYVDPNPTKPHFTAIPAIGYSLQTGVAGLITSNLLFHVEKHSQSKASTIITSIAYTEKHQIILPLFGNIWTKGNRFNFISNNRYMSYPSETFGTGTFSLNSKGYLIKFSYLKLHETVMRKIIPNFFLGGGYFFDSFWNIKESYLQPGQLSPLERYHLGNREKAASLVARILYDSRLNSINPARGAYISFIYSENLKAVGSDNNWNSMILELKKFIPFPAHSGNILALWSYNWVTLSGEPPYLMLPSVGWDDVFSTGRGYIQGRYKGRNLSYVEAEYRFRITRNGLFGGVIFGNYQAYYKDKSGEPNIYQPGYGLGLRIKLNKESATNFCLDYGFGANGSKGVFLSLGEVF